MVRVRRVSTWAPATAARNRSHGLSPGVSGANWPLRSPRSTAPAVARARVAMLWAASSPNGALVLGSAGAWSSAAWACISGGSAATGAGAGGALSALGRGRARGGGTRGAGGAAVLGCARGTAIHSVSNVACCTLSCTGVRGWYQHQASTRCAPKVRPSGQLRWRRVCHPKGALTKTVYCTVIAARMVTQRWSSCTASRSVRAVKADRPCSCVLA